MTAVTVSTFNSEFITQLNANFAALSTSVAAVPTMTGAYVAGNVPILTATGIQDSGVALVSTMAATSVWANNTASSAAPQAVTVLTLGNGTAAAPIYSFQASTGTGLYSPTTNQAAITVGGKRLVNFQSADTTSYLEVLYSTGMMLRSQGGTNVDLRGFANGTGETVLGSNGGQGNCITVRLTGTAVAGGASNYLRITVGDGAGNGPILSPVAQGTADTNIDINVNPLGTGSVKSTGNITAKSGTAVGAGAATQAFIKASSTADLGIYYGTGAPGFSAAKGSLYSRTDATTTTTRLYVNTDGATTWANFTASA